jgi:hypothetical protein
MYYLPLAVEVEVVQQRGGAAVLAEDVEHQHALPGLHLLRVAAVRHRLLVPRVGNERQATLWPNSQEEEEEQENEEEEETEEKT